MGTQQESQISAVISSTTRALLEHHVRATGVKKGHLVEEAILHHLRALHALPTDIIVPARIVVSRRSGREITKRMTARPRPTKQLRALMTGNGH
jgi:hypothetical protein